jgi:hypothetical protein
MSCSDCKNKAAFRVSCVDCCARKLVDAKRVSYNAAMAMLTHFKRCWLALGLEIGDEVIRKADSK